mmetsp:Transcript_290/g.524  ORF Transcript_290/g.524 Transcript_290/m.524 type:complete len:134 (+) Transcript_290:624-1025(+)
MVGVVVLDHFLLHLLQLLAQTEALLAAHPRELSLEGLLFLLLPLVAQFLAELLWLDGLSGRPILLGEEVPQRRLRARGEPVVFSGLLGARLASELPWQSVEGGRAGGELLVDGVGVPWSHLALLKLDDLREVG